MRKGYAHHEGTPAFNVSTAAINVRQLRMLDVGLADRCVGKTFRAGHFHYAHAVSLIIACQKKG